MSRRSKHSRKPSQQLAEMVESVTGQLQAGDAETLEEIVGNTDESTRNLVNCSPS